MTLKSQRYKRQLDKFTTEKPNILDIKQSILLKWVKLDEREISRLTYRHMDYLRHHVGGPHKRSGSLIKKTYGHS